MNKRTENVNCLKIVIFDEVQYSKNPKFLLHIYSGDKLL